MPQKIDDQQNSRNSIPSKSAGSAPTPRQHGERHWRGYTKVRSPEDAQDVKTVDLTDFNAKGAQHVVPNPKQVVRVIRAQSPPKPAPV